VAPCFLGNPGGTNVRGLAGIASLLFHLPVGILSILTLAGAITGALSGLALIRREKYGIEPRLMQDHARWLMSGETVLILQAPIAALQTPWRCFGKAATLPCGLRHAPENANDGERCGVPV